MHITNWLINTDASVQLSDAIAHQSPSPFARISFDRAMQVGANDYVKKPFSRDEVARQHPRIISRRPVAPQRALAPLDTDGGRRG